MKKLSTLLFAIVISFNLFAANGLEIGDQAPGFKLKNVEGEMVALNSYSDKEGVIVIFSCNHCPYVKLYEDRMIAINEKYADQGYPVVAINSNDPKVQPEDSYEKMKVRAEEKNFTFPYLYDATQDIAKAYGAARTPHVYLLENTKENGFKVAYIGAIDNDTEGKMAKTERNNYLESAIEALKENQTPDPAYTKAIGCTIKWEK